MTRGQDPVSTEVMYVGAVPLKRKAGNFIDYQVLGAAVHRGEEDRDAR